jgi:HEPN domain-containing protein
LHGVRERFIRNFGNALSPPFYKGIISMKARTAQWVEKAEGNFDVARLLRRSRKPNRFDVICFQSQQCVENYVRARLTEARVRFSIRHGYGALLKRVKTVEPHWLQPSLSLNDLSNLDIRVFYPGMSTDQPTASAAFEKCTKLREVARRGLGLHR